MALKYAVAYAIGVINGRSTTHLMRDARGRLAESRRAELPGGIFYRRSGDDVIGSRVRIQEQGDKGPSEMRLRRQRAASVAD